MTRASRLTVLLILLGCGDDPNNRVESGANESPTSACVQGAAPCPAGQSCIESTDGRSLCASSDQSTDVTQSPTASARVNPGEADVSPTVIAPNQGDSNATPSSMGLGGTMADGETAQPNVGLQSSPLEIETQSANLTREGRSIDLAIHLPQSAGPYPLLLFAGGFQVPTEGYVPLMNALAASGFVVLRADLEGSLLDLSHAAMAEDLAEALDWAISNAPFSDRVDPQRVGSFGHSLGGKLAVMLALAETRVGAVFAIDPVDGDPNPLGSDPVNRPDLVPGPIGALQMPLGFLGEITNSMGQGFVPACAPAEQNYQQFFAASTGSNWVVQWTIPGADHMDFVWNCPQGGLFNPCSVCPDGTADPQEVRIHTQTLVEAFFLRHLQDELSQEEVLIGDGVPSGIQMESRISP